VSFFFRSGTGDHAPSDQAGQRKRRQSAVFRPNRQSTIGLIALSDFELFCQVVPEALGF
jgi:hypothetical protein